MSEIKYKEISPKDADAMYVLGIPLEYRHEGKWNLDPYRYSNNPRDLPSLCPTTHKWRVQVDI